MSVINFVLQKQKALVLAETAPPVSLLRRQINGKNWKTYVKIERFWIV